ncbi:hypothetical protein K0M31_004176 [Melipona bicolor]|uniref:Uncharacterized protein n=1 Tax=Melipona bicolor TaxID=60889 RepID=A0AA40KN19_9HYME|nr:hypothetical protein K0M31_004176 [Melipona bicolor]
MRKIEKKAGRKCESKDHHERKVDLEQQRQTLLTIGLGSRAAGGAEGGNSKLRDRGAAITQRFSGQVEGVAKKGVLPEREGRAHRTPAERCILDAERRDAQIRRIPFVVLLLSFKEDHIKSLPVVQFIFPTMKVDVNDISSIVESTKNRRKRMVKRWRIRMDGGRIETEEPYAYVRLKNVEEEL